MPTARVNGVELYYEESGSGDPLLFISGLGRDHLSWALVTPHFEQERRCIVFDNRGTGKSEVPPGPYTIEEMADDTAALIRELGIGPTDVVGVSLGGSVLQALSYRHPDVVRRAVFVSAFPNYTPVQHAWLDCLLALREQGVDEVSQSIMGMAWVFTPRALYDHETAAQNAKIGVEAAPPAPKAGFEAQAVAIRTFDSRSELHKATAPSLILVGAEDVLTPPYQSAEMASLMPNAKLQILPRGSHGVVAEYMDDVIGAIKRWFKESNEV
ncbi:MAG: alpha/beta hydrolase [Dehalococcoidia bacterium]|nr:alpha/beta hydrolase [Dehalococcoidia bacterium]